MAERRNSLVSRNTEMFEGASAKESLPEAFSRSTEAFSPAHFLEVASHYLDAAERLAFSIYIRRGLPGFMNAWRPGGTTSWRDMEADPPREKDRSGIEMKKAFKVARDGHPADSEVGFATAILERAYTNRIRLAAAEPEQVRAFAEGFELARDIEAWHIEYALKASTRGRSGRPRRDQYDDEGLIRAALHRVLAGEAPGTVTYELAAQADGAGTRTSRAKRLQRKLMAVMQSKVGI